MTLPSFLQNKIEIELNQFPLKEIRQAYEEMSSFYRVNRRQIHLSLNSSLKRLAYIAARMPATYASVFNVLKQISLTDNCLSILDVGAGCGTASFAASEYFRNLKEFTTIEQNAQMISMGKRLAVDHPQLKNINWMNVSMTAQNCIFPKADLVILSYSFNEISPEEQSQVILKLWEKANKYLIFVEPGTTESFQLIHSIRNQFNEMGDFILAPCTHTKACPAYLEQDFCHFPARVQRTSYHRFLKQGDRNFEDEKYAYLILTKEQKQRSSARIVRKPISRSGYASLKLCTENGFIQKEWSKKDKEAYRQVKNLDWGDTLGL